MFHVKRLEEKRGRSVLYETFGGKREDVDVSRETSGEERGRSVSRETFGKKEEVNIVRGINL